MSEVSIPVEYSEIIADANHEAAVILSVLQTYIAEDRDAQETRLFTRGQLARLIELNAIVQSAIDPDDVAGDDIDSLLARLNGKGLRETSNA